MILAINARVLSTQYQEGIARYLYELILHMSKMNPHDQFHLITDGTIKHDFSTYSNIFIHKTGFPARHPILWKWWFEYFFCKKAIYLKANIIFAPEP